MTTEEVKSFEENFEWTAENELHLFDAMDGPKPVGINKHFVMALICEKFETLVGRSVPTEILWKQMNSMYDMAALDKKESIPFPSEEEDFNLPEDEFGELMSEKVEKAKTEPTNEPLPVKDGRSTPKVTKENKQTKETTNKKEKEKEKEKEEDKEKKVESEEKEPEGDKKESEEPETEVKKGKGKKEDKPAPKRGKRSMANKKTEEESPATNTNNKKSEEEAPSNKKEKQPVGKRTLRSRGDDSSSNKSSTPPPSKRARRI